MVFIAQLAERPIVIRKVMGSTPISHPDTIYLKLPDGVAVAQMFLVHLGLVRIQLG
jgi:hypothetical protein